jgi:excisionase family DNA binding protein
VSQLGSGIPVTRWLCWAHLGSIGFMAELLLRREEAAVALNVSIGTISRMVKSGQLVAVSLGPKSQRITADSVTKAAGSHAGNGTGGAAPETMPAC